MAEGKKDSITAIDIEVHRLIVCKCEDLLSVVTAEHRATINSIKNQSLDIIDRYNGDNHTVVNLSKIEIGNWEGNMKKVIYGRFRNPVLNKINARTKKDYLKEEIIRKEFKQACENTVVSDDLKLKYILLRRKIRDRQNIEPPDRRHKLEPLESVLNNILHTKIQEAFQEQNKQLLTKYT